MENAKVNYLHFCDAANIDSIGKVSILGIFDKIFLQSFPGKFPKFSIVVNLTFKNLVKTKNKIAVKILDPNKKNLEIKPPIEVEFIVTEPDLKKQRNMNLILDLTGLEFKNSGRHQMIIYLNNNELARKELQLEERKVK